MPPFDQIASGLNELGLDAPEEKLVQSRAWNEILSRYYSIDAWNVFAVCAVHMTDAEYFPTARHLWANSEGAFTEEQFDAVFLNHGRTPPQTGFMTSAEVAALSDLPNPFPVYRGCQMETTDGISWTISMKVAETFANRAIDEAPDGKGLVLQGMCPKAAVIAYFDASGLHEAEVLIKASSVLNVSRCKELTTP